MVIPQSKTSNNPWMLTNDPWMRFRVNFTTLGCAIFTLGCRSGLVCTNHFCFASELIMKKTPSIHSWFARTGGEMLEVQEIAFHQTVCGVLGSFYSPCIQSWFAQTSSVLDRAENVLMQHKMPKPQTCTITDYLLEAVVGKGFTPKEAVLKDRAWLKTRIVRRNFQVSDHCRKAKTRRRLQLTCFGRSPSATFHFEFFFPWQAFSPSQNERLLGKVGVEAESEMNWFQ